jgi:hypothetical protein
MNNVKKYYNSTLAALKEITRLNFAANTSELSQFRDTTEHLHIVAKNRK